MKMPGMSKAYSEGLHLTSGACLSKQYQFSLWCGPTENLNVCLVIVSKFNSMLLQFLPLKLCNQRVKKRCDYKLIFLHLFYEKSYKGLHFSHRYDVMTQTELKSVKSSMKQKWKCIL